MLDINKIYNLNCIKLFEKMKNEGLVVDAIITDPPYNISRKNNFKSINRNGIDFGEWDKQFDQLQWIEKSIELLKPGGNIIIFNDWKNMGQIAYKLESLGFDVKDIIRWIKPNPMPRNTSRRYVTDYEFALWAVKSGGKWTFNKRDDKPYMIPEYKHGVELGTGRFHPTQKSLKLMAEIIKTHTNTGDLILDPFMGSGTTAVAALLENRKFIGSEKSKDYFEKSIIRICNLKKK